MISARDADGLPDFARLFEVDDGDDCWQLTPRMAAVLYGALRQLATDAATAADRFSSDAASRAGEQEADEEQLLVWPLLLDEETSAGWYRVIVLAAEELAGELAKGLWPTPRFLAELVVLRAALGKITGSEGRRFCSADADQTLPRHPHDDAWTSCEQALLEEFDATRSAIRAAAAGAGLTKLGAPSPAVWFEPFFVGGGRTARPQPSIK